MVVICEGCLTAAAPGVAVCPNCGSEKLRAELDGDEAARKAKGEAPAAPLLVRTPKRETES